MSKSSSLNLRVDAELFAAIQEAAAVETGGDKTKLIIPILQDVFQDRPVKKVISVPITGWIVEHPELGNVIIGGEGYDG